MAEFEAFDSVMNAFMGWGAVVLVLLAVFEESIRLVFCVIFSLVFWGTAITYIYLKTHKKPRLKEIGLEPSIAPLTPETVKPTKPKKVKHPKWTFLKNLFFITLEVVEASYFFSLITTWEIVRVQSGNNIVPVLTYQNGILSILFVIGLFLVSDLARRLRHPRKAFFE